jgi:hypothetical protein
MEGLFFQFPEEQYYLRFFADFFFATFLVVFFATFFFATLRFLAAIGLLNLNSYD